MRRPAHASMGPPPFGDGNSTEENARMVELIGLQLGHRLSAMETYRARVARAMALPLQWGHRLSAMETSVMYEGIM